MQEIEETRKRGYAMDNEENELGVRCIVASIKHGEQKPQYAFSISAPIHRMDEKRMKEIAEYALAMKKSIFNANRWVQCKDKQKCLNR